MKPAYHVVNFFAVLRPASVRVFFLFMALSLTTALSWSAAAQGPGGNVLKLDGVDSYVNVPALTYATNQPITIEFWNYVPYSSVQPASAFNLGGTGFSDNIQAHAPWTDLQLHWDYGTTGGGGGRISVSYAPYFGRWTHIALVSAGNTAPFKAIYINGVLVASEVLSDGPNTGKTGLTIGKNQTLYHIGRMDEFRIWNVVRTQQQIQDNMLTSLSGNEAGLRAAYNFNEPPGSATVSDASPNGFTGTLMGGAELVSADEALPKIQPPAGNAIQLDGVNDHINVPTLTYATNQPITIEFWNYVASADVQQSSVFNIGGTDFTDNIQAHGPWTDYDLEWDYGTAPSGRITVSYAPYLDRWTHVALVSAGSGGFFKAIYLNGILVASDGGASEGPNTNKVGLTIGRNQHFYHKGKIDEFRVWNVIRSQQQIFDNMNSSLAGNEAGLRASYSFDEPVGSETVADASPNGYTGSLVGGALLVDMLPPVVQQIARHTPTTEVTTATSVTFRVSFNEPVTGFDQSDFTTVVDGGPININGVFVSEVSQAVYDVTVAFSGDDGTLGLKVLSTASLADLNGNPFNSEFSEGDFYTIHPPAQPLAALIASQSGFTPIAGGTPVNEIEGVDAVSSDIPLEFPLFLDGNVGYGTIRASSNGFLTFNTSQPQSDPGSDNNLSGNTLRPLVAPFWDHLSGEGGQASYVTTGEAPNRIFTFEWLNWRVNLDAEAAGLSFQVKLYEGTNNIEFVYRQEGGDLHSASASIGVSFDEPGSFLSLNDASHHPGTSPDVEINTINTKPATGQSYKFVDVPPVFTSTGPMSGAKVTNTKISYELSGNIASGTVTWTRIGGTADPASPHVQALAGNELNAGLHSNIILTNSPALETGAIYSIAFNGVSVDGLAMEEVVIENITIDKTLTKAHLSPFSSDAGVIGIRSVLLLNDEESRMMIAGELTSAMEYPLYLARLYGDGSLDNTFDQGTGPNGPIHAMALQNGKVIVAGEFSLYNETPRGNIVRLNDDGSIDETFVDNVAASGSINALLVLADGKILIGGSFTHYDGNPVPGIARLNEDGTFDNTFNSYFGGEDFQVVTRLLLQQDSKIIVATVAAPSGEGEEGGGGEGEGGGEGDPGSQFLSNVFRLNDDGTLDETFAEVLFSSSTEGSPVHAMAVQADGKIIVGGDFVQCNEEVRHYVARLNANGTVDNTFNTETAINDAVHTVLTEGSGKILIGGGFAAYAEHERNRLARLLPDGSLDLSFEPDGGADGDVYAIVSTSDHNLLIAGDFVHVNNEVRNGVAILDVSHPYVVSSNRLSGAVATKASSVTFRVFFNETVQGVNADDFTPTVNGVTAGNVTVTKLFGGLAYNVTVHSIVGNGTVRLDVNNGTLNDLAGNAYNSFFQSGQSYTIDQLAPVFSETGPAPDAYVSSATVSYSLSEALASGNITWTRTGGAADANSPHIAALAGAELTSGDHTSVILTNNPVLVNGAIYTISFSGVDAVGNASETLTHANVIYDNAAPVFSEIGPESDAAVAHSKVSYLLSETLVSGSITWTRTGGAADVNSPHVKVLTGEELTLGDHNEILLTNNPGLVSGAIYSISFSGEDAAGNISATVTHTNVVYDNIAPVFSETSPETSGAVSNTKVSYLLSEDLFSGYITWIRTGGAEDANSPHVTLLAGEELTGGDHKAIVLANNPTLVSGAIYSISFNGADAAGNSSVTVTHTDIVYDDTAPAFSEVSPASNTTVSSAKVSYVLSESLAAGTIIWTRTGGTEDVNSPHVKALTGDELSGGDHNNVTLSNSPVLVNGAIYSISFDGTDAVGNAALQVMHTQIMYRLTKADQVITFTEIGDKTLGDVTFAVTATSSSGLTVAFATSSDKITLTDGMISMHHAGRVAVVASQSGNEQYNAAVPVERSFCIRPTKPLITHSFMDTEHPVLTSNATQGNQWYLNNLPIEGATGNTYTVTDAGTYKVKVQADDCFSDFSDNFIVLITGLGENTGEKVDLYPNPATDYLTINGSGPETELIMIDVAGKVLPMNKTQNGRSTTLDVRELQPGVYILNLANGGKIRRTKFVKK